VRLAEDERAIISFQTKTRVVAPPPTTSSSPSGAMMGLERENPSPVSEMGMSVDISRSGIVNNKPYILQAIKEVAGFKICCLRKVWGFGEWTGRFSAGSSVWDNYPGLAFISSSKTKEKNL